MMGFWRSFVFLISCCVAHANACDRSAFDLLSGWRDALIAAPDTLSPEELAQVEIATAIDNMLAEANQDPFDPLYLAEKYNRSRSKWNKNDSSSECNYSSQCNQYDLSCLAWAKEKCEKYRTPTSSDIHELAGSRVWKADFEIPYCMEKKISDYFLKVKVDYLSTFKDKIPKSRKKIDYSFAVDRIGECPDGGESPFMACFLRDKDIVIHKKLVRAAFTDVAETIGKVRSGFHPNKPDPSITAEDRAAIMGSLSSTLNRFIESFEFLIAHELTHAYFGAISGEYFADCMATSYMTSRYGSLRLGMWDILKDAKNTDYIGQLSARQYAEVSHRFDAIDHLPQSVTFEYCRDNYYAKSFSAPLIDDSFLHGVIDEDEF